MDPNRERQFLRALVKGHITRKGTWLQPISGKILQNEVDELNRELQIDPPIKVLEYAELYSELLQEYTTEYQEKLKRVGGAVKAPDLNKLRQQVAGVAEGTVEELVRENELLRRLCIYFLRKEDLRLDPQFFKRNLHAFAKEVGASPEELGSFVIPMLDQMYREMLGRPAR